MAHMLSALYAGVSVYNPSVRHMGGSVKNG